MFVDHKDGVPWYKAPAPPKRHAHRPHTVGLAAGEVVWRCPCGAISGGDGYWTLLDPPRVAPAAPLRDRLRSIFRKV